MKELLTIINFLKEILQGKSCRPPVSKNPVGSSVRMSGTGIAFLCVSLSSPSSFLPPSPHVWMCIQTYVCMWGEQRSTLGISRALKLTDLARLAGQGSFCHPVLASTVLGLQRSPTMPGSSGRCRGSEPRSSCCTAKILSTGPSSQSPFFSV